MTFSIVAYDPDSGAHGVAVASKFLAVGAVVSWSQGGVGAVATQSFAKIGFGPDGLAMLAQGKSAQETLAALLAADPGRETRQVGIVDTQGGSASFTGAECFDWAGHRNGTHYACQGNILTGGDVIDAMVETFVAAKGALEDRLLAALQAGDAAGGDKRGRQGAGLLVTKLNGGYGGDNDRYLDLRVDDDPAPVAKLAELVDMHHLFFGAPKPEDRLPINEAIARELQAMMRIGGYVSAEPTGVWDETSKTKFWELVGNENVEERWNLAGDTDSIDSVALAYLRKRFGLR
jgi:uncharacterized Ntn-hydrolase superfamily protein